jgi:O-antigen/teichoic acid export membrane protein
MSDSLIGSNESARSTRRVSAASIAVSFDRLKRRALSLGAVKALDHAMHALVPVVLVRCLDTTSFGEYRLLWLVVGTLLIATLNMGGTLYYFVPRSPPLRARLHVHHAMLYLALAGAICGFAISPLNPLLPATVAPLEKFGLLVPAFVALWLLATLLDNLPAVDERIRWQVTATSTISMLRTLLVCAAAWLSGDLRVVMWALLFVILLKVLLLLVYVARRHGLGAPWFERAAFSQQFRHSAPIGLTNALFSLRSQSDQWIVASLFAISSFAAFSIAAIIGQVMHLFRVSVLAALLPSMSRLQAAGDVRGMMEMASRGNLLVGRLLYPLLGFTFVFAHELVTVVYTASYSEAVPVIRVYILGMLPMVIEMGSLILLLRQGPYAMALTAVALCLSIAASWTGAQYFGLPGAAAGSVLAVFLDRAMMLRRVSQLTGIALRRLQDWRSLGNALALAAVSAALAWLLVERLLPDRHPFARLALGAAVLGLAYAVPVWRRWAR